MDLLTRKELNLFRTHYLILEDAYDKALEKSENPELGVEEDLWIREVKVRRGNRFMTYFEPHIENTFALAIRYEYISEYCYNLSRYFKRLRLLEYMTDPDTPRPKNYSKYLESPRWSNLRKHILSRDGHLCICGKTATVVHHKTYERTGKEYLSDLVSLCQFCHTLVHLLKDREKDIVNEDIKYNF